VLLDVSFVAPLWEHDGQGAWHFVTVPEDVSDEIEAVTGGVERRGFGSVRVEATIGASTWRTSLFPDKASSCYVLPVKKPVRIANDVAAGDEVEVRLLVEP
jgi:hypothetical protein